MWHKELLWQAEGSPQCKCMDKIAHSYQLYNNTTRTCICVSRTNYTRCLYVMYMYMYMYILEPYNEKGRVVNQTA